MMRLLGNEWQLPSRSVPISIQLTLFYFCTAKASCTRFLWTNQRKKTLSVQRWGQETFWCGTTVQTGTLMYYMTNRVNQLTVFSLHKSFVLPSFTLDTLDITQQKIRSLAQTPFHPSLQIHQRTRWNFNIYQRESRWEFYIQFVTLINI